jgi:hypothetical protein
MAIHMLGAKDPELFSQPDESKRAEKMLELAILSLFRLR